MTVRIFDMASPKLLVLLVTVNCVVVYRALGQTFQVLEGIEDKKFIGSVAQSSELQESIRSLNLNLSQLQYTIFSTGNPQAQYFVIDDSTGAVYTDGSLDREVLCGSEVTPCTVQLDVSVHNKAGFLKILNVQIIVGDVNDNSPVFPNSAVSLQISESEPVGSTVTFRGASDRDSVGVNSEISYELTSPGSPFELSVISYPDRTQDVVLRVARALDRELVPSYQLQIVARDGGEPQKTGTAVVDVVITDVNDNYPEFSQKVYSVTIREDLAPNTPVLQVSAQDLDSGDNGKVMYRLSTPTNAFFINATSGSVIVGENVDFEQKQVYRLMVEASDSGAVPKTRKAQVVVNVSDVNDNSPEVSFNFLPSGDHAVVPEHSDLGTFVAYMSVSDKDQGQNALVKCSMQGTRYTLESQKLNEYKIKLLAELDREVESGDYVSVVCVDSGRSPRTATAGFSVVVQDVNDHSPILPKQQYSITVQEGLSVGTVLLNVTATDKDFGENGRVSYRIHGERAAMFAVSDTGVVWLNLKLDREQADTITVNLVAEDHGSPSKSTNATIIITITDINDEKPVFSQREYRLNVTENSEGETVIGQVVAEDSDLDEGGQVRYKLTSNYDSQFFSVSPDTGVITAKSPLDRENRAIRELVVIAEDQGEPSLSASVAVFIKVLDLNDNTPVISFPAADNYSLSIPSSLAAHSEVVTVVARDKDEGENARLTYILLEQGRMPEYFRINQTSGRINLVKEIRAIASNVYKLSLAVRDNGIPQRETIRNFRVHVTVVNETAVMSESESGKYNVVIVISVIAMTAVLSAVILGTICIIRRRDSKQVETSNIRPDLYDPPSTRKTEHKNPNVGEIVRGEKMYEARAVPVHKVPPVQSPEIPLKSSSPKGLPPYSKATEQQHLQYIRDFFPSDNLDLSTVSSSDQSRQTRNTHWQDQPPNVKAADSPRRSSQRQPNSSRKQLRPNRVQWALEPESGPGGWGPEHTSSGELQILPHPDLYGRKPDDSTSDLSGDPSDSGRGGSDDDVHRGYCLQIEHEGVHGHYV